ncbi:MAG: hydrogenase expression/formation protein HypE [Candidatus Aenigmarchaeota archaeon]|nr:hydrogenase expression/formation protein HypE [Candidatus Aenigmarchaeota archaeon]
MVTISDGAGGLEMGALIDNMRRILKVKGDFSGVLDDGAYVKIGDKFVVFTTDSFTVEPVFFPGGDIGKLAVCGTINDLCVMGARPIGLSLALVIEEGFSDDKLWKILESVNKVCEKVNVPVVTGDTKVLSKGDVRGVLINVSGVGIADEVIANSGLEAGDKIVVSGSVGDHGAAILSSRFGYESSLVSDCAPVFEIVDACRGHIKACKDPTRGGLSACLNELALKSKVRIVVDDDKVPVKREVRAICDILGVDVFEIACEGRIVFGVRGSDADEVLGILREFDCDACVIGDVVCGENVVLRTAVGEKIMNMPRGENVVRIC